MRLYKLNANENVAMVCDHISGDEEEVRVAITSVMGWDNSEEDIWDEEATFAGNPYILSWFEVKEEFR